MIKTIKKSYLRKSNKQKMIETTDKIYQNNTEKKAKFNNKITINKFRNYIMS